MLPSLKATNMSIEYDGKLFEGEVDAFSCRIDKFGWWI